MGYYEVMIFVNNNFSQPFKYFIIVIFGTVRQSGPNAFPGREKMRSLQGSCKILVKMQLLVRSCKEMFSLKDLARKCFP